MTLDDVNIVTVWSDSDKSDVEIITSCKRDLYPPLVWKVPYVSWFEKMSHEARQEVLDQLKEFYIEAQSSSEELQI